MSDATWLDADRVAAVMGEALADDWDESALNEFCSGVRAYVESRRPDLFVPSEDDPEVTEYRPTADVITGAAMLAYRFYTRRQSPLGILGVSEDGVSGLLREDPDIAKLLGVGRGRRFVFGGPRVVEEAV